MECSEKPVFHNYTGRELAQIRITPPDEAVRKLVKKHWDTLAKPLDGMGSFETITAQIGAILGTEVIDIRKKGVLLFCADNGIVEEGVTQSGQEVTLAVAKSMARKGSSVCRMAQSIGAETIPVDIGINSEESIPGVWNCKVCSGTRNFLKEPAMTEGETVRAIATGTRLVRECKEKGYGILATGEMGIGNTTTSSAVTAALLQCEAEEVTGRGAGLTDQGLARKQQVVRTALENYDLWHADAFTVLQTVGGLDIAGLTGMCIGGALWHVPIVLDGGAAVPRCAGISDPFPSRERTGGSEAGRCFTAVSGDPCGNGTGRRNRSRYDVHTAGYGNEHLWTERYLLRNQSRTI